MRDRLVNDDDLRLFFLMHRAIRSDLARLPQAVAALDANDSERLGGIRRWLERIAQAIEHHHRGEDEWLYPRLARDEPAFEATQRVLEAEHHALDPALARARVGLDALSQSAHFERDRDVLVDALATLRDQMQAHLDVEEAATLGLMKRFVTVADLKAFEQATARRTTLADLALVLPWMAGFADVQERVMLDAILPWPVKWILRWWWQPSYARLAAALRIDAAGAT